MAGEHDSVILFEIRFPRVLASFWWGALSVAGLLFQGSSETPWRIHTDRFSSGEQRWAQGLAFSASRFPFSDLGPAAAMRFVVLATIALVYGSPDPNGRVPVVTLLSPGSR